jgi:hypothetical protein
MKKIIITLIIFLLIFFFIGLFFAKKETLLKITKENQKQEKIPTSSLPGTNKETNSLFILDFEKKVNEELNKLTEKIKPDENKSLEEYRKEITQIQQQFKPPKDTPKIDSETLMKISQNLEEIAKELSQINPPPLFYSFHLELIKINYKLSLAFKEFVTTTDPNKKILLYNLIKATLEKIKF